MSVHCPECGAVASYGYELGHRAGCKKAFPENDPRAAITSLLNDHHRMLNGERHASELKPYLRPCPFCGETPALYVMDSGHATIYCKTAECPAGKCFMVAGPDQKAEIENWNRRKKR